MDELPQVKPAPQPDQLGKEYEAWSAGPSGRLRALENAINGLAVAMGRFKASLKALHWRLTDLEGGGR